MWDASGMQMNTDLKWIFTICNSLFGVHSVYKQNNVYMQILYTSLKIIHCFKMFDTKKLALI